MVKPASAIAALSLMLILTAGCARTCLPALPDGHPASPEAQEAPPPERSDVLAIKDPLPDPVPPEMKAEGHTSVPEGRPAFVCPMHPNVRAQEPGKCPVCGMGLVKQGEGEQ